MNNEDIKKYLSNKRKIVEKLASIRKSLPVQSILIEESPLDCLLYLGAYGHTRNTEGATKRELRVALGETRDITRATRKLEDRGLIYDKVSENDRRQRRIKLTDEGKRLYVFLLEINST